MTEHEHDAEIVQVPFAQPEFNQADFVADDLIGQIAQQAKTIAVLRGQVAQLDGIIKANADKLGLQVNGDGTLSTQIPAPNRAARRSTAKRSTS